MSSNNFTRFEFSNHLREWGWIFDCAKRQKNDDQSGDVHVNAQVVLRIRLSHLNNSSLCQCSCWTTLAFQPPFERTVKKSLNLQPLVTIRERVNESKELTPRLPEAFSDCIPVCLPFFLSDYVCSIYWIFFCFSCVYLLNIFGNE